MKGLCSFSVAAPALPKRGRAGLALLWALLLAAPPASAQEELVVRYLAPVVDDGERSYFVHLLDLALGKAGVPYRLEPAPYVMSQHRALKLLHTDVIDVAWAMTTPEHERAYRPIRTPIFNGLIGARVLLVRCGDEGRFARVASAKALRRLRAVQGHDWPDTAILEHNGFRVEAGTAYAGMFEMLLKGRVDFFPRSVLEVWAEADRHAAEGLCVEPRLLLHYPAALYFFIAPANAALAEHLERGLQIAQEDGSFNALFEAHFAAALARSRLAERRHLDLASPFPAETPAATFLSSPPETP